LRAKIQSLLLLLAAFGLFGCGGYEEPQSRWAGLLGPELQAMGYRNWVVVADAAFPVHSRRGVRTLAIDGEIPEILDGVVESLESVQNVSPRIYLARELRHVDNNHAPGIDEYRKQLDKSLHGHPVRQMDYKLLSLLLEDSSKQFSVLVLKTRTALPYSAVFIEMDSGYWDNDSERELRKQMEKAEKAEKAKEKELSQEGNEG
jgi:L-fucose mutarotase/ribose pyranase (RbsD/FucU family)